MKTNLGRSRFLATLLCLMLFGVGLSAADASPAESSKSLPRLVDLGADRCIPCKLMAPILAELKRDYTGQLDVEFIDVWKNAQAGESYHIRVIPTQIFFDAAGQERFRHEGFMSKKDILTKWSELGIELKPPATEQTN